MADTADTAATHVNSAKPIEDYNLESLPPEGHPDLGRFVWQLFEASYAEQERLGLIDRRKSNYKLFRGNHWGDRKRGNKDALSINLFFANLQRTVANITAKNPVVEVVDLDGGGDKADQVLSAKLRKWWNETEQQRLLSSSCLRNELYGVTFEKMGWSRPNKKAYTVLVDAYAAFPPPDCPDDIQDAPYFIHAVAMDINSVAKKFGVDPEKITVDDVRTILGKDDREEVTPNATMLDRNSGIVHEQYKPAASMTGINRTGGSKGQCLVIECWLRDYTEVQIEIDVVDPETGAPVLDPNTGKAMVEITTALKYPDGIRVITVTNGGQIVLSDEINPNISIELPVDAVKRTYAWGRYPFFKENSYEDAMSIWGFSAAEQVGDLNKKIDEVFTRMAAYVNRVLYPPLIIPKGYGITKSMISNKPGLTLMPNRDDKGAIRFLQVPNLPANFFQVLDILVSFHDRVYQIEDADRGVTPNGVTAASAIVALQERNAVLIQHKIKAIERLARERGRWAISFIQNFGNKAEWVEVQGEPVEFIGVNMIGRRFNYLVESGSTVAKTSIQTQEQAVALFEKGAIDRQALLETLNFPSWKEIIERVGEGQLGQALQILVQAGLDEKVAMQLKNYLMEKQAGGQKLGASGGGQPGQPGQPGPGTPRGQQGQDPRTAEGARA